MKKISPIWVGLSLAGFMALTGALFLLWYPLIKEGRLGRIARLRLKVSQILPGWDSGLRTILLLPSAEKFQLIQQDIYSQVTKEMEKEAKGSADIIQKSAVSMFLYLRPSSPQIAFPVDPDQSPVEMANDPELVKLVISQPEERQKRNELLWQFLKKNSPRDMEKIVDKSIDNFTRNKITRNLNPLVAIEIWLRENQLKRRIVVAHDRVTNNLQAANGAVSVRLNPKQQEWDPRLAIIDVTSKRFSSFYLDRLSLTLTATPSSQLALFGDTNHSGRWENDDQMLGKFDQQGGVSVDDNGIPQIKFRLNNISQLIFSTMEIPTVSGVDPYYGVPMFDGDLTTRFFLRAPEALSSLGIFDLGAKFKNAVTGKDVDPEGVRFIDDETTRYLSDTIASGQDFVSRHPEFFLQTDSFGQDEVILISKKYVFSGVTVVPNTVKMRILPGAKLQFMPGASLISYAPVFAEGTQAAPIEFTSAGSQSWSVFAIVNTKSAQSFITNVVVENASSARVNGINFSGGLAAHQADIRVINSIFRRNHGDDGMNIKYSQAIVESNTFTDNDFDGLDLDVVSGEIKNNKFIANGNDGLDVSWNKALIKDNVMSNNQDKCLSIGEKSIGEVVNNLLEQCATGIAVKDLSDVEIKGNHIRNNREGISVFQKKPFFGGGIARLSDNIFENNQVDFAADDVSKIIKN